jgi:hypothetical protein
MPVGVSVWVGGRGSIRRALNDRRQMKVMLKTPIHPESDDVGWTRGVWISNTEAVKQNPFHRQTR